MPTMAGLIQDAVPVLMVIAGELYIRVEHALRVRRKAASALSLALGTTESYLDHLRVTKEINRDLEAHISTLWDAAYNALLPIYDTDVEKISALQLKAAYWQNPEGWCDAGVDVDSMQLSTIRQALRKFIRDTKDAEQPEDAE